MVMEASPSPQCVGREFVRQYYTLLNSAPAHLHRFYNNYSSFIHGGLDSNKESSPAIGQIQIHQKIQALNFQDCHAKINQVDSQLTLGSGVVVQVSGELSNAGHPMRRFTQTFVLAPQAPKKYYVHNDIFRYQDFGYGDEDEEEVESGGINEVVEREVDNENVRAENEDDSQQNQVQQLSSKVGNIESHNQAQPPSLNQQQQLYYTLPNQQQIHPALQQVTVNGSVHDESPIISQQTIQQQQQPPIQQQYISETVAPEQFQQESELETQPQQQQQQLPPVKSESPEDSVKIETEQNFISCVSETEIEHQIPSQPANSGPTTYANLFKSSGTTVSQVPKSSFSPPPFQNLCIDDSVPPHQQSTGSSLPNSTGMQMSGQHVHRMSGQQSTQQQQQQQQFQQRMPRNSGVPMQQRDGDRRRPNNNYSPDSHQLFLGNLPHNATESELRLVFEQYGRVVDLRVHSKPNDRTKGPNGQTNRLPNYGFITFEDYTVVSKVLADCPIYFPNSETGQKLNVEEKKTRLRDGNNRQSLGGDSNMRSMGGQSQQQQQPHQQQQQRGPGGAGMMRGGQHGARGRGGYNRGGGESGRGGLRQAGGNPNNQNYPNRR